GTAAFAIVAENQAVLGTANSDGILQQRLKDALEVERRSADDLEHVGRDSLLLQRFAQIIRALPQLVEQPRVLDGDDGLVGKILNQVDLLVDERPDLLTVNEVASGRRRDELARDAAHQQHGKAKAR